MKRNLLHYLFLAIAGFHFSSVSAQGSLDYDGTNDFINLPSGIVSSLNADYTIETWVYWRGASNSIWQRIFDFGTGTDFNMFLTPGNGTDNTPRFAITQSSSPAEQQITAPSALSLNTWHHIAVVITNATNTGRLFIDGVNVASNPAMTLRPSSLGITTQNYFGRSQYGGDPYYNGYIEEVRISNNVRYTSAFTPQHSNFSVDANTIALYHFDEGAGQTINDATGNFTAFLGETAVAESSDPARAALTSLPVGLLNFKASVNGNKVTLGWQTAFEQNNKGFFIERSVDAISFNAIGFVNGAGNSSSLLDYYYSDPLPAASTWYRLRQEDLNGRFNYSNIVMASPVSSLSNKLYWYPAGPGTVEIRMKEANSEAFYVTDAAGHILRRGNLSAGKATITSLSQGTYTISIITKNHVLSTLIIL